LFAVDQVLAVCNIEGSETKWEQITVQWRGMRRDKDQYIL